VNTPATIVNNPTVTYTVTGLTDGLRYCFAVTAYDTSGNESAYSNEVCKTLSSAVPPPSTTAVSSLVGSYYTTILNRTGDSAGIANWTSEILRLSSLGVDVKEGFQDLARFFFASAEYVGRNWTDAEFVTDLYHTFLGRSPEPQGMTYWTGLLSQGLTRDMVITAFAYSQEFKLSLESRFGASVTRPENNLVNDFYRGFLNRIPDTDGFGYWLTQMRQAQCVSADAVRNVCQDMAFLFSTSAEYMARGRSDIDYLGDAYNATLRRQPDLPGLNAWLLQLGSGATRVQVLDDLIVSPEFRSRVESVVNAGCTQ
jgi:hypothetical protein